MPEREKEKVARKKKEPRLDLTRPKTYRRMSGRVDYLCREFKVIIAMKPTVENLKTILKNGSAIGVIPENLPIAEVRKLVRHARRHGASITLHYTDMFTPAEWELLSAEGGSNLTIAGIRVD